MTTVVPPTSTGAPLDPDDPGFVQPGEAAVDQSGTAVADQTQYENYYGFDSAETWYFPDHKQYIQFKRMNEGERAHFQQMTTRDVTVVRGSGDAKVKVDPATERRELIVASVTGWHLVRPDGKGGWQQIPFSKGSPGAELEKWLNVADPRLVDELEQAIRKANPWLLSEMSVEDIDKQMDQLREMREQVLERKRGEGSSSSR
jgi:hypothetical protein